MDCFIVIVIVRLTVGLSVRLVFRFFFFFFSSSDSGDKSESLTTGLPFISAHQVIRSLSLIPVVFLRSSFDALNLAAFNAAGSSDSLSLSSSSSPPNMASSRHPLFTVLAPVMASGSFGSFVWST